MDSNGIRVLAFVFFSVFCIIPIKGRDLAEHENVETNIPAEAPIQATRRSHGILDDDDYTSHVAGYSVSHGAYHGLKAEMSIWKISDVKPQSYSMVYISASNQDRGETIIVGVHVDPGLYRNHDLRFFVYWATAESPGCFNNYCPGFVVAKDSNLHPGQALAEPFSTYDNDTRYITLRIKKDEQTGDWSVYREDMGGPIGGTTLLGWWPKSLFKDLADNATTLEWKGEVAYRSDEQGPSMGSGQFAEEGDKKAAYFGDIVGFDYSGDLFTPLVKDVTDITDKGKCYDVSAWNVDSIFYSGSHFYYGGPSGCNG